MNTEEFVGLTRQIARQQPELTAYQQQIAAAQPAIDATQTALDAATAKEDPREKLRALRAEFALKAQAARDALNAKPGKPL